MDPTTAARRAARRAQRAADEVHALRGSDQLGKDQHGPMSRTRARELVKAEVRSARAERKLDKALMRMETSPGPVAAPLRAPRITPRGLAGPGNGRVSHVQAPPEWRAPTVQACGMFPWAVGGSTPTLGVPLGRHLLSGTTVSFDPYNWFARGSYIPNPSTMTLGLPGLGKSSLTRRQVLGLSAQGVRPLVLGDLKPDYVDLVRAIDGQVVKLGRGLGSLNPLEVGALAEAATRLSGKPAERLHAEAHGRRLSVVTGLVQLTRGRPMEDFERSTLSAALRVLHERAGQHIPTLPDLVALINEAPEQVRASTLDRGDDERYHDAVDPLQRSLMALLDGPLGDVFARPTTTRLALDSPGVAIDVSGISSSDSSLQAAVLLACWSDGFGAVEAANALADAGVAPQRHYFVVLDELWRVLRSGVGMVDNVDALTRLNRTQGVAMSQITHTLSDMKSLARAEDVEKARGFVERAGAIICGGLPPREFSELQEVVSFTAAERQLVTSWSTPPSWDDRMGPPGQGNFLIKVGTRPGVPLHVDLTQVESRAKVHETNARWQRRLVAEQVAHDRHGAQGVVLPDTPLLSTPTPNPTAVHGGDAGRDVHQSHGEPGGSQAERGW